MSKFKKLLPASPGLPQPDQDPLAGSADADLGSDPSKLAQSPLSTAPAPKKLSPQAYVATPALPAGFSAKPSPEADYLKVSVYLQRQTVRAVKQALLEDPEAGVAELSDLIEALLTQWLGSRS